MTDGQKNGLSAEPVRSDPTPVDLADETAFTEAHHRLPDAVEHALWQEGQESGPVNRVRFLLGFVEQVFSELNVAAQEGADAPQ